MAEQMNNKNNLLTNKVFFCLIGCFALVLSVFFFTWRFDFSDELCSTFPTVLTGFVFIITAIFACYFYNNGSLNNHKIIILLVVCGFALRLAYVLKYKHFVNQHDVESLSSDGHLLYIFNLAKGNGLPKTNNWQFCHPPLHHALSALVVKFSWVVGLNNGDAFENVQLLTCFYSALTLVGGVKLLQLCGVKGKSLVISSAFLCFHPTFFILAGSINNDALTVLLMLYSLIFLIKWCKKPTILNALVIGLFTGLGMMTKFSAVLMVGVTAITVVVKFIKDKNFKISKLLLHTLCFLVILLPLGLWFSVRNYVHFEQPLGYVAPLGLDNPLYTGDISLVKRIILPFSTTPVGVYTDVWNEYNLWTYLLRNSLFGEYRFGSMGVASILVTLNALVIILAVAAMLFVVIKKYKQTDNILPVTLLMLLQMAVFIYFYIKYPYGCSMDFRYIVPTLFCTAVFFGNADSELSLEKTGYKVALLQGLRFVVIAFCLFSVVVFI